MRIGSTEILDTHAEAFRAWYVRILVTASGGFWLDTALHSVTGYGTSVIGCDAEVGVERKLGAGESPDGRAAAAVLLFAISKKKLSHAVGNRVGQCVLTCPTTACFNGLPHAAETIPLGDFIRYFGDGYETRQPPLTISSGPCSDAWHIPVMDGEFVCDPAAGVGRGVAGGNIILHASTPAVAATAALRAVAAVEHLPGVIMPFPAGVCRSGSKVGSKYARVVASTHEAYCPTLRDHAPSKLAEGAACAYELVINGVDRAAVVAAMRAAMKAAAGDGVLAISAANFGGKLGKILIPLREILHSDPAMP